MVCRHRQAHGGIRWRTLRQRAMESVRVTRWFPRQAENRMASMVETRPTGCCRASVPGAFHRDLRTQGERGDPGRSRCQHAHRRCVHAEGADAWFNSPPQRFLGDRRDPDHYEQVMDILDVWFDPDRPTSSLSRIRSNRHGRKPRAPISISKAPTSIAAGSSPRCSKAAAPAARALRSGFDPCFVLDERGHKMFESLGNTLLPQTIADKKRCRDFADVGGKLVIHRGPPYRT